MTEKQLTIRTMHRAELDSVLDWAAAEGWNPGLHDADCFFAADPEGFFVGLRGNEPVASISAVKYGESFGFIGFYLVKPGYRGRGYGLAVWKAAIASLQGRCIGLDGVPAQQDNYRKSDFQLAYRNIRYQGTGGGPAPEDAGLVDLSTIPFETVCRYDAALFPEDRSRFLRSWLDQPQSLAFGALNPEGRLTGYGVMRRCRSGYKMGPLFADRAQIAEALFLALKAHAAADEPVFLDIPEVNPEALALVRQQVMTPIFETARMYTGNIPELDLSRLFGVTTFELG
ncbi:MAG: GNAT family N-acetyltransferase [Desulfohalobiaceae bacterium]|nr:GNAT family N-acetyltransferase [Desulfohalobiaceae bacterium]